MIKIIATLSAAFIFSTASAQHPNLKQPDNRPKKYHHGRVVSTAAHQTYARTEKGKFISRIARLKTNKPAGKMGVAPAKRLTKAQPIKPKIKPVKHPSQPVRPPQRVVVHKASSNYREMRVHRPTPVRRQVGHARFTQVGRG
ncbi:hypothetical protein [Adhaeribacter rhizoryzae]|uniref:Uncharacterized protein n=1 Tax=Adhaeribacter rhizoryzae TaxID=2607907 RepID=A0A5M6DQ05_9BACT|nr:hypothetical protein [Adhaeribacter rhizoryzae]KAA5549553.1 hypothetical protein F0145_02925 [Adhaeribacter rhizoryzae]